MGQFARSSTSSVFQVMQMTLQDCSFLERVLQFSFHVCSIQLLVGFSLLYFMFLFLSFYIFIELFLK